jgi:hypothetical protein
MATAATALGVKAALKPATALLRMFAGYLRAAEEWTDSGLKGVGF